MKMAYRVRGVVERGEGIASGVFEVPTANIRLDELLDVQDGVYASLVQYNGVDMESASIYRVDPVKLEVHIFGLSEDLYGKELSVLLLKKVSEIVPWVSVERMRQKIHHDLDLVKEYFQQKK